MRRFFRRPLGRIDSLVPFAAACVASLLPAIGAAQEAPVAATAAGAASNYFNPSISVIGDFLAVGGSNDHEALPNASFRESEISFHAAVDPYARADVFVGLSDEGAEIEEAVVTFTSLPAELLAKIGRVKVPFGRVNTMHTHALPWPDVPLPGVNLLGGDEGWRGDGAVVSRLLPIGETFSELLVGVYHPSAEGLFESDRRSDVAWSARWRLFRDLDDDTNVDFGVSFGGGPNGTEEGMKTRLSGGDLVVRWKPLAGAGNRSLIVRGEWIRSERKSPEGEVKADGWYAAGDWQLARRWFAGLRVEASDRADEPGARDRGEALTLTFRPSEFSSLRGELRRRRYAEGEEGNEALLQLQFSIGAHGAHSF